MERTYIKNLSTKVGQKVLVKGFVQTIRDQGGIKFLLVRDITGIVQCVATRKNEMFESISDLTEESIVGVAGTLVETKQTESGYEIQLETLEVLSKAGSPLPLSMVEEKGSEETDQGIRLDFRWLDLRKSQNVLIFRLWTCLEHSLREYFVREGYFEIHSPKFLSTPSEGGGEEFEVKYFDRKAYLAQSPQFYKQMAMASGFEKVFEIGPVFRANPSFTTRHDTEFTMYDMEISFIESHYDVMCEEEQMLVSVFQAVKEKYGAQIKKHFGQEITVPSLPFPKMSMTEAKKILKDLGITSEKKGDFSPEEERKLGEYVREKFDHEFVFITEYPAEVRPFYHMRIEPENKLTKSYDLLFKGLEITTGAQREHRSDILTKQAIEKGVGLESIKFYLDFFRYGCPPHGGFGFGPSRLIMKMLDLPNVREATYLYRGIKRLTP